MGHAMVTCTACHDQLRQTAFYEPAHDSGHDPLTGWVTAANPRSLERVGDDGQRDGDRLLHPGGVGTPTTQMISSAVCALMILASRPAESCPTKSSDHSTRAHT